MDFVKIISDLLSKNTNEEIREYLANLKMNVPKEEFTKVCESKITDINIKIKNYIIKNGEAIIKIFDLIRKIKEEFFLLKKSFDTMKNQMIILKKKYIEPFEKLNNALINKSNIEKMIILFDKAKKFKEDVKIIKTHYEKDTLLLSLQNFDVYLRLVQNKNEQLKGIVFIKEEYDWLVMNEENILEKYRQIFIKKVMNKNNEDLLKFFELFSNLNILVTEIKDLSNKILKDLMIENFLNKIIRQYINVISLNDMNYNNICKIRKELNNFFETLDNYSDIFDNLGNLLKNSYDKKNFILYENIMELVSIYLYSYLLFLL